MTRPADEFELIARYFAPLAASEPGALGLVDDAAQVRLAPGRTLVVTTDSLVASVHFRDTDTAADIAAKVLAVNLSDLAAMGAEPFAYTLSVALPESIDEAWVSAFAASLGNQQARFGVTLIGGDTVATPGPLTLGVTALGTAGQGGVLTRAAARPGDAVWVSGTIGDAALGLRALDGEIPGVAPEAARSLVDRYLRPLPRIDLGQRLVGLAGAAIDVSDGLVADLAHVCRASAVDATIEAGRVPLSPAARRAVETDGALLEVVLTGGDDYEILFTAPPSAEAAVAALSAALGLPLSAIGSIGDGVGEVRVVGADGAVLDLARGGYRHF